MMRRIFQISKADEFGGGASKVAAQLNRLLNKNNYSSDHLVSWAGNGFNNRTKPLYKKYHYVISRLHYLFKKIGLVETIPFEYFALDKTCEIYHFHDLSSAISPNTLRLLLKRGKKVIWTIHDCSPFTGGCLYPMGCDKYKQGCGQCPQLGQWPIDSKIDLTNLNYKYKKKLHKEKNLIIVCPSQWMANFAKQSGMAVNEPIVIPNAVDRTVYNPDHKYEEIVNYNGLKVILSAGDIADKRKGIYFSLKVLKKIEFLNPLLIIIGNVSQEFDEEVKCYNRVYAGYVSQPKKMAKYLASADIFLFCSLADNMPLSLLEALSCSTPVFGFKTGGMSEVIENGYNGFLSEAYDIDSIADAIKDVVENDKILQYKINALESSVKYDESIFLKRHVELYKEIL